MYKSKSLALGPNALPAHTPNSPEQPRTAPNSPKQHLMTQLQLLLDDKVALVGTQRSWEVCQPQNWVCESTTLDSATTKNQTPTNIHQNQQITTNTDNTHTECNNNPVGLMCALVDSVHLDPRFYQSLLLSTYRV